MSNEIDLSFLRSVSGGDEIFEKLLLTNAMDDIESNIEKMQSAYQCKDVEVVSNSANTLKPVLSITGLLHLENLCTKVEAMLKNGLIDSKAGNALNAIIEGWVGAKPKLQNIIAAYK